MKMDEGLMERFPILRKKVTECERLLRDVRIWLVYDELRNRGDNYSLAISALCKRFKASPSTVKRAVKKWEAYNNFPEREPC